MVRLHHVHGQIEIGGRIVDAQHVVVDLAGNLVEAATGEGRRAVKAYAKGVGGRGVDIIGGVDRDLSPARDGGHGPGGGDANHDGAGIFGARAVVRIDKVVAAVAGLGSDDFGGCGWGLCPGACRRQGEEGRGRRRE